MDTTLTRVRSILTTTPQRWLRLAETLPTDLFNQPPVPGEWSAAQCLQHLIDLEHIISSRLKAFQEGRDFQAFNPDQEGTQVESSSPTDLAAEFNRLREDNLQEFDQLSPADFSRTARHAELGPVTLEQMLNQWAAHDLNHTVQAEEALMQPFIRACGPWRTFFTAHIIGG